MPEAEYPKMGRRIRGCDTCQLVCPHNARIKKVEAPNEMVDCLNLEKLLTKPDIERMAKYIKLSEPSIKTQATLAAANTGRHDLLHLIEPFVNSKDEMLAKIVRWAVLQLAKDVP